MAGHRQVISHISKGCQNILMYNFTTTTFDCKGNSQGDDISARAIALAHPDVAPPLVLGLRLLIDILCYVLLRYKSYSSKITSILLAEENSLYETYLSRCSYDSFNECKVTHAYNVPCILSKSPEAEHLGNQIFKFRRSITLSNGICI